MWLPKTSAFVTGARFPSMLSRFSVVLLDMNGTFMFGGDRFGPEENFAASYHRLGGSRLADRVVQEGVRACFEELGVILRGLHAL